MAKWIVTLINQLGTSVPVPDLGLIITGSETRRVSDTYSFDDLSTSIDLKALVLDGTFVVNNGTDDLSAARGANHVFLESFDHVEDKYVSQEYLTTYGHTILSGRDTLDSHPMEAITNGDIVEYTTNKGVSGGYASLDSIGKVPASQIPTISVNETWVVTSEVEQLALIAVEGDIAIRVDEDKSYIHNGGSAGTMGDWYEFTSSSAVNSVQGRLGNVTITQADLGLDGVETDILSLSADTAFLSGAVDTNITDITNNSNDTAFLSGAVDYNILDISNNYTEHVALSGALDTNTSDISNNTSNITSLSAAVDALSGGGGGGALDYFVDSQVVAGGGLLDASILEPNWGTNVDVVISPLGTGALIRDIPDGTSAGGDARGIYATDLQGIRGTSTNVASANYSTIAGGEGNSATGTHSSIGGGEGNAPAGNWSVIAGGQNHTTLNAHTTVGGGFSNNATQTYCTVAGGNSNTASQIYATIVGGISNIASGSHAFVGAGNTNTASGAYSTVCGGFISTIAGTYSFIGGGQQNSIPIGSDWSTIAGGHTNTITGDYSTIAGGFSNDVSGAYSVICGGYNNESAGDYSITLGGNNNIATGDYSVASGIGSNARMFGSKSHASGNLNTAGDAQSGRYVLRCEAPNATPIVLTTDGTGAASTTNQINLQNNQAITFLGTITAKRSADTTNVAAWKIQGLIVRGASAATTTLISNTKTVINTVLGWDITIAADTTNGGLSITLTSDGGATTTCVASVTTSELTY